MSGRVSGSLPNLSNSRRAEPPLTQPSPRERGEGRKTLRSSEALAQAGLIGPERLGALQQVAARYAVAITPAMAELVDPADPADPIARQFVPDIRELDR